MGLRVRPFQASTGTVHVIHRLEERGDGSVVVTTCDREYSATSLTEYEEMAESDLCGQCVTRL